MNPSRSSFLLLLSFLLAWPATLQGKPKGRSAGKISGEPISKILSYDPDDNSISVGQNDDRRLSFEDRVCIRWNKTETNCGKVILTTPSQAMVRLSRKATTKLKPKKGEPVWLEDKGEEAETAEVEASPAPVAAPAPILKKITKSKKEKLQKRKVAEVAPEDEDVVRAKVTSPSDKSVYMGVGFASGFSYSYPMIHFHFVVDSQISLGISLAYVAKESAKLTQSVMGGWGSLAYHFDTVLTDFYTQFSVGAYAISAKNATQDESATQIAGVGLFGWRPELGYGFTFGAAVGGQYVAKSDRITLVEFSGLLPLILLEVGCYF